MFKKLPSNNVPLMVVADVACFLANNNNIIDIEVLKKFTNKSEPYIRSSISICKLLNIIDEDGRIDPFVSQLGKTPNEELRLNMLRKFVQEYEPFVTFVQYHLNDASIDEAARKVYVLYGFEGKDAAFLRELFMTWGTCVGILMKEGFGFTVAKAIESQLTTMNPILFSLDEDMAIRIYISNILGAEVFSTLVSAEVEELVNGYKKCEIDARGAIECAGRAFEDFMRRISLYVGVNVSVKNGIGQVVNALYNNKDGAGVLDNKLHSKQSSIGTAIADIRNMAGHGLEARTMERWELTPHSAKIYIGLVLSLIKSVYEYVYKTQYVF